MPAVLATILSRRDRRAKQREDTVAGRLHDVAIIAAYGVDHKLQRRINDGACLLRIEVLFKSRRVDDVDKQRCDQLSLPHGHEVRGNGLAEGDAGARRL
jgi:hypothetical protein